MAENAIEIVRIDGMKALGSNPPDHSSSDPSLVEQLALV
jgi:hypothetical protein